MEDMHLVEDTHLVNPGGSMVGVGTFVSGLKAERNTTMVLLESETEPILEPEPAPEPEPEPEPDQVVGVLQFLTAWIIVGWIWCRIRPDLVATAPLIAGTVLTGSDPQLPLLCSRSIYWGWLLYSKAGEGWHSLLPGK